MKNQQRVVKPREVNTEASTLDVAQAITDVYVSLAGLSDEQRKRVVLAAATLHGIEL